MINIPSNTTSGMELLVQTMSQLWYELNSLYIPIINIRINTFVLSIILVSVIIKTISIIIGSHDHGNGKD